MSQILVSLPVYSLFRWVALGAVTIVVVALFGGTFIAGSQIKSLEERTSAATEMIAAQAESARAEIESRKSEAESEIEEDLTKIRSARKEVVEEKEEFDELLKTNEGVFIKNARESIEEAVESVAKKASVAVAEIEKERVATLGKLGIQDVKGLSETKEELKTIEERQQLLKEQKEGANLKVLKAALGRYFWLIVGLNFTGILLGVIAVWVALTRTRRHA